MCLENLIMGNNFSEKRIGVFVCRCGTNIGGYIEVDKVVNYIKEFPDVVLVKENIYMCSSEGLNEIKNAIKGYNLTRIVVASCTPRTHESTFRSACHEAGLNPYLFEMVNIREQCSWVHMTEKEKATLKAIELIKMGIAKVKLAEPAQDIELPISDVVFVVGAGISGMTSALSIAKTGFKVVLIDKNEKIGGLVRSLNKIFPEGISGDDFVKVLEKEIFKFPNIELHLKTTMKSLSGYVGNYEVIVSIADEKCGDGEIRKKDENITKFGVVCGEREIKYQVGVIIIATGAEVFIPTGLYNYDGKKVITQFELEKILKEKKFNANDVVMIQCVGARDEERQYCSRICCSVAMKNALEIRKINPNANIYILYRDIQTYGIESEIYYESLRKSGIIFIAYDSIKPPFLEDERVIVYSKEIGTKLRIPFDLIVLSTPLVSHFDTDNLAKLLKVPLNKYGFFNEAHIKLKPVEFATDGIFVCGSARWPAFVDESISQALSAASKTTILLNKGCLKVEPIIACVSEEKCIGCGLCVSVCPYKAMIIEKKDGKKIAKTISVGCKGCGACASMCPAKAINMQNYTDRQIFAQIEALLIN